MAAAICSEHCMLGFPKQSPGCAGASSNFRGQDLAVVGGGDTAAEEAIFLTKYGKHVRPSASGPGILFVPAELAMPCQWWAGTLDSQGLNASRLTPRQQHAMAAGAACPPSCMHWAC